MSDLSVNRQSRKQPTRNTITAVGSIHAASSRGSTSTAPLGSRRPMLADPGEKCLPAAVRMPLELMMDTSIPDATPGPESTPPGATPPEATAEATPAKAAADALHGLWAIADCFLRRLLVS